MFILGAILLVLGIVFLLQNMGVLPYDTLNNIWPIVLILGGLWLMFTRRGWSGQRRLAEMGMGTGGWSGREDRSMGSTESRAYGHENDQTKDRMHDKRPDEM